MRVAKCFNCGEGDLQMLTEIKEDSKEVNFYCKECAGVFSIILE